MDSNVNIRREREVIDLLLKEGLITQEKLEKAREETRRTGLSMGNALEKLGFITYEDIVKVQATALGLPYMDLSDYIVDAGLVELIPVETAKKHKAVPLFKIGNTLTVGMVDPKDIESIDNIRRVSKVEMVEPVLVSERGIQKVIDSYYGAGETVDAIVKSIDGKKVLPKGGKVFGKSLDDTPVIDLINIMFAQAVKDRVSDMHLEPTEETLRVRFRIDGLLREVTIVPKTLQSAIISRIKILSKMDIAESRKPQDGRIRLKLENKDLDIRVSTFPTLHGENVVMRLLDKTSVLLGLKEVGMLENDLKLFEKVIRRPNGIILVTGPTGSGKTSTLYAALTVINSIEKNIITIEDPVEYELPLIRQTQVNPLAGITFANGLRGILRQDPDIIMVGEIRDKETADVAIQAALTGHLVFSTLHTNDAASALTRLIDMGVEPFLASSSVIGILAQRLVRLICDKCKETYSPAADVLKDMDFKRGTQFFRGKGCPKCNNTGLKGRTGIFELLVITEEIRTLIDEKKSADEIGKKARESGMRTLRDDGLLKAKEGLTTLEEVLRVTEVE
ncbi:MAG TPA: type II secretion system protein GspE [Candidatus Omnitrophica bacterium]|nr:type II secretion system protein GspE [Candidatus Omnitrophota bacterium]